MGVVLQMENWNQNEFYSLNLSFLWMESPKLWLLLLTNWHLCHLKIWASPAAFQILHIQLTKYLFQSHNFLIQIEVLVPYSTLMSYSLNFFLESPLLSKNQSHKALRCDLMDQSICFMVLCLYAKYFWSEDMP